MERMTKLINNCVFVQIMRECATKQNYVDGVGTIDFETRDSGGVTALMRASMIDKEQHWCKNKVGEKVSEVVFLLK